MKKKNEQLQHKPFDEYTVCQVFMLFIMATTPSFNLTEILPTAVAPHNTDSAVIGVVILLVLCTLAGVVYLLYRYMCHNKGIYRTTGEAAPGVDPDQVVHDPVTENKEYFI